MGTEHFTRHAGVGEALVAGHGTDCSVLFNLHRILEKVALEWSEALGRVIPPVSICHLVHLSHTLETLGLVEDAVDMPEMLSP